MVVMKAPELIHGPYLAPTNPGDTLHDAIDGDVLVGGWSAGRIPWPRKKKTGKASLIVCAELEHAVRMESSEAIQYWFGVGPVTVWKWRKALGVDRQNNPGTRKLYRDLKPSKLTEDRASRGRAAASAPDAIARMATTKRGVPAPPAVRESLLMAAKARKPEGWGNRANQWMIEGKRRKAPRRTKKPGRSVRNGRARSYCRRREDDQ